MSPPRPLEGRTVLLTRPGGEAHSLAERLVALGARVVHEPVLAFESRAGSAEARAAADRIGSYDLLVFTSGNGARFFADALRLAKRTPAEVRGRVAAVGPGTVRVLRESGFAVHVVAADSRAEGLAEALRGEVGLGSRVLWARAEAAGDVLPEALRDSGAAVDEVRVYRTVASPSAAAAAAGLSRGEYGAVVFASPSAFRLLLEAAGDARGAVEEGLRRARRVAIGGVTAEALARAGFPASAIASIPTDEGLEAAVLDAFRD